MFLPSHFFRSSRGNSPSATHFSGALSWQLEVVTVGGIYNSNTVRLFICERHAQGKFKILLGCCERNANNRNQNRQVDECNLGLLEMRTEYTILQDKSVPIIVTTEDLFHKITYSFLRPLWSSRIQTTSRNVQITRLKLDRNSTTDGEKWTESQNVNRVKLMRWKAVRT